MKSALTLQCVTVFAALMLVPTLHAQKSPPEVAAAVDEAQGYFEEDRAREAVATLADAAARNPKERLIGAMLYAAVRDHIFYIPQTLPVKHKGPVRVLAFSPDITLLASGSSFGDVHVSPTASLDPAAADAQRITINNDDDVVGLLFTRDGKKLAIVTKGAGVKVWDLATRKPVFEAPKPEDGVSTVATSRDGKMLAVGSNNGTIQIIDIGTSKVVATLKHPAGKAIHALAFSRSGTRLAAAAEKTVRAWILPTGEQLGQDLPQTAPVAALDFSYDDRYILAAAQDGVMKLCDPDSGEAVMPAMPCGVGIIKASISPDGSMIASMLEDATVLVWDAFTGQRYPFTLQEDPPFTDFAWSASGLRIVTASFAGHTSMWTMQNGIRHGEQMPHGSPVLTVSLSSDSKLLATGCEDGTAHLWRTDGGLPLPTVRSHAARARSAFYSVDGQHLVTAGEDFTALHWISGKVRPFGPALKHPAKVVCATFNQDASRIVSCDESGAAHLWDAATGREDGPPVKHDGRANWVDFHPDGQSFVVAAGSVATIWKIADRTKPAAVVTHPDAPKSEIKCARFSPNGKWLVTASTDGTARIWDAITLKPAAPPISRGAAVLCVRFSPDSSHLVVAGEDGQAAVFESGTWKPVGTPILMPGPIFSAAITEDNQFITVSSLLLNAVQFFDIQTGHPLGNGVPIPSQATCLDYHVKDHVVIVACDDGTVRAVGCPFVAMDVPPWMCTFAEELVGLKKTGPETFAHVAGTHAKLQAYIVGDVQTSETDFPRLARWKLTTGNQRHGMPRFISTLADNIANRVDENSTDSLFECYDAAPGDPLVLAALSLFTPNRRQGEFLADFVLGMDGLPPLARAYAAATLVEAGRSQEALRVIGQTVADAPRDPRVLRRAAKVQARLGNKAAAREFFAQSLQLEPGDATTYKTFGWALYNFHDPAAAAAQFRAAQDLVGDMNDDLLAGLCLCSAAEHREADARDAYLKLLQIDPAWAEQAHLERLRGWTTRELGELERIRQLAVQKK